MLGKVLNIDASEVSKTHVERNLRKINTYDLKLLEQFAAEMEPGSRGSNCSFIFCKDSLISFTVLGFNLPVDELWKRCLSETVQCFLELLICTVKKESQGPSSRCGVINNLSHQQVILPEVKLITYPYLSGRINKHIP